MTRLSTIAILFFVLISVVYGQSGRRAEPSPTPAPAPADDPSTYSESTPNKRQTPNRWDSIRDLMYRQTPNQGAVAAAKSTSTSTDGDDVVRVETSLITIPVSVFDRSGVYVPNLKKEDFRIFEDGKEQEIEYFGTSEKPFTVVLLIDVSPSAAYRIDEIHAAAVAFVNQLKPEDKVMVIEFDRKVNVLADTTGDRAVINKAIRKADFGGGTSLYDAVSFSLVNKLKSVEGRKAIVLFTDGVDTSSTKANYETTLALAEASDSLIFPIYYNTFFETSQDALGTLGPPPPGTTEREYAIGFKYLNELAAFTGGRVFRPEATEGGLTRAFEGIAEELRRQYNIGYIPNEVGKTGQRKEIRVRVNRPNLSLRARDSYIVGAGAKR